MNGARITLVRVKRLTRCVTQTFTTRGIIVDGMFDEAGRVTAVRVRGVAEESGRSVDAWYAVGPGALAGSLCESQTATLDGCGHAVTYGCDCDTIAAEADGQDDVEHTCGSGIAWGCDRPDCGGDNGD